MKIRKIITLIAALLMLATATATAQSNTVTLTPETGEITLNDGDILSGKGGENTKVQIAAGTTITLSGVDITNIPNNSEHE